MPNLTQPEDDWLGDGLGEDPSPERTMNFVGYYFFGENNSTAIGLYLKEDAFAHDLAPGVTETLRDALDDFGETVRGIEYLVPPDEVPEEHKRTASGALTLAEILERGKRITGVRWGAYYQDGSYFLWVGDSG